LSGFSPASDFGIGIDIGSANLYNKENHNYVFRLSHNYFTNTSLSQLYSEWLIKYPIFYLEDALAPDDTVAWQELSVELGEELVLAGDKLFTNDSAVLRRGLAAGLANSVVVNLQEYKSIVDVVEFVALAKKRNYQVVFAAAEQETNDSFIADLAVALGADFVKFGALARGERLAKYNRLLSISRRLENFF
jgi:enolase